MPGLENPCPIRRVVTAPTTATLTAGRSSGGAAGPSQVHVDLAFKGDLEPTSAVPTTTGALPDGVLHSENEITSDQAQDLKAAWIAGNGGRQRGPAVLSGGVKYQPLEFSSVDMELLDSRRYNAEQMCTLFGVPPHLVGVPSQDSKTYSNVQQDSQFFVRFTLRPLAIKIEEALSTLLPRGQRAVFNFDAVLRADTQTRYDAYETALRAGFMTIDEVRALEGLT